MFPERASPQTLIATGQMIGRLRATLGDRAAAQRALRDALAEQRKTTRTRALPRLLETVAGLRPEAPAAPALLASAAALRERWNIPVFPFESAEHERVRAAVRAKHGAGDAGRSVADTLSRDDAIACAAALLQDQEAG
jgi:hypothetical protein